MHEYLGEKKVCIVQMDWKPTEYERDFIKNIIDNREPAFYKDGKLRRKVLAQCLKINVFILHIACFKNTDRKRRSCASPQVHYRVPAKHQETNPSTRTGR